MVLYSMFLAQLVLFFDNGIPPAISTQFKQEMRIEDAKFGMLGSAIFVGQATGSLLSSPILQKCEIKTVLAFCLFIAVLSIYLFCLFRDYTVLLAMRFITGMMQVMFSIYIPVWADSFGTEEEKPQWFALTIAANPLGTILGYGTAALV
jgi:predicted MFS family arabinose efflux permease